MCGIRAADRLYCWGNNHSGGVGDGTDQNLRYTPIRIAKNKSWRTVAAGHSATCGVVASGRLYCWGSNDSYEFGIGKAPDSTRPTRAADGVWAQVWPGEGTPSHTCGIRPGGVAYCWGVQQEGPGRRRDARQQPQTAGAGPLAE